MIYLIAQALVPTPDDSDIARYLIRELAKSGNESYIFLAIIIVLLGLLAIPALGGWITFLFFSNKNIQNERVNDQKEIKEEYKKVITSYYEISAKNIEVIKNLTDRLEVTNKRNEELVAIFNKKNDELIEVLESDKVENLKAKIKVLEDKAKGGSGNV